MRRITMIPILVAVALLSVTAPVLAGPFEFPWLQPPGTSEFVSIFDQLPAPAGTAIVLPSTVLDERAVR